ncbi:MAG: hypothetical protein H7831_06755, partial [Magnetococcus sp. WYHC-3]
IMVPFLQEMEEFTLLTRKNVQTLVENALAAKCVFNQQLCNDAATLLYRTNLKISRDKILKEWRNIAKKVEHPVLAENVQILSESENFESSYDKFLDLIFEAISNREAAAEALATTLQVLREKTPKIKESHELSSKLNSLIERLKKPDFDDASIYEAEDLIATIQEELAANENLGDFDQIPGDDTGTEMGAEAADMDAAGGLDTLGGSDTPVININAPLIQIGGTSSAKDGEGGLPEEEPLPPMPEGGGDELDALLGNNQAPAAGAAPGAPPAAPPAPGAPPATAPAPGGVPPMESRKRGKAISESRPSHYEMNADDDDLAGGEATEELEEAYDPYAIKDDVLNEFYFHGHGDMPPYKGSEEGESDNSEDESGEEKKEKEWQKPWEKEDSVKEALDKNSPAFKRVQDAGFKPKKGWFGKKSASESIMNYGAPVISDEADIQKIVKIMGKLAIEHKLSGKALKENLETMAKASIEAIGLRVPASRMDAAVDQAINLFMEMTTTAGIGSGVGTSLGAAGPAGSAGLGGALKSTISDAPDDIGEETDDANPVEDQRKTAVRGLRSRGYGRTSIKNVAKESIRWGERQNDAVLGEYNGVRFVLDHGEYGSGLEPVVLSEDGAIEIPVPGNLHESAFAAAKVAEGDGRPFVKWLSESIEQLRPLSDDENRAIQEATAKITTGQDGSISVEVTDDVEVDNIDDEGDEQPIIDEPDVHGLGEPDGDESEMAPVDSLKLGSEPEHSEPDGDEMPDFEKGEGTEGVEEEEGVAEDKDITSPKSAKYTKHVKDNKREVPDAKLPSKTDDTLEGIGPELKKGDGTGANTPYARKGSDE